MKRSQNRDKKTPAKAGQAVDHYAQLHRDFRWQVDEYFNIAEVCCGRWARAGLARDP